MTTLDTSILIEPAAIAKALGYTQERLRQMRRYLTEGLHYYKIGSHYFYTAAGKKKLIEIQTKNKKYRNKK